MGTKNSPGLFGCYQNAAPDEPMFILLARDASAPGLVRRWVQLREEQGYAKPEKLAEALECARAMEGWKAVRDAVLASPVEGSYKPLDSPGDPMLQFFAYEHLPVAMQAASRPFCELARHIVATIPRNPERTVSLRKLLEGKDAAVRSLIFK